MIVQILSILLILLGLFFLIKASFDLKKILKLEQRSKHHKRWYLLFVFVLFFSLFYLLSSTIILLGYQSILILLIGIVFFAGALFVKLVGGTSLRSLNELRKTTYSKERLSELNKKIEHSYTELNKFAYLASHDLKTPLRGISNLSSFIQEDLKDTASEETKEHLDLIKKKIHEMETLLSGIIEYSEIDHIYKKKSNVNLQELILYIQKKADPENRVNFIFPTNFPELYINQKLINTVFEQLISNAIRFNTHANPYIEISFDSNPPHYVFIVKDNGPGISQKYQHTIFEMFKTLNPGEKHKNSGIGLSLVKKIIEKYGGNITLSSSEKGAEFTFTIPFSNTLRS